MKKLLKGLALVAGALALLVGAGFAYASSAASGKLAERYSAHEVDFPVPMPLTAEELAALRADGAADVDEGDAPTDDADSIAALDVDLDAIALERAIARGKHLVESRFLCVECHGADFGGGVMVEDPAMGALLGPNLTTGAGSLVLDYSVSDWDRIVRHGIRKDGTPALMPSEDFVNMSDRELSDIIAYIRSVPPVDREIAPSSPGPVLKVLLALDRFPLSASLVQDHQAPHAVEPPAAAVTVEFGRHLAQVCTGCHRQDFAGGAIAVGPPGWPPASNLTVHEDGLAGWSYEQFATLMRTGQRPDGAKMRPPMDGIITYAAKMTETEMQALWRYLESLPPTPLGR